MAPQVGHGKKKLVPLTPESIGSSVYARTCKLFLDTLISRPLRELTVLDVGCGRGDLVGLLRSEGVRAFGVDINPAYLECGSVLSDVYPDQFDILSRPDEHGRTIFPDAYFDLVVSFQVLEHVENMENFVSEIARLNRPGGWTVHLFPAKFRVAEPHFGLPFVHWLPKNGSRKAMIRLLLAARIGNAGSSRHAGGLFNYSVKNTLYRHTKEILQVFQRFNFVSMGNVGVNALIACRTPNLKMIRGLMAPLLSVFWTSVIVARRD